MKLFLQDQFKDDFDNLQQNIQSQTNKALDLMSKDLRHPSLATHAVNGARTDSRKIFEAKVNEAYRILWEYIPEGIAIWRVGPHAIIDAARTLGNTVSNVSLWSTTTEESAEQPEIRDSGNPIFANVSDNILRLLGVNLDDIDYVRSIDDKEQIWDLSLPENVRFTLYDVAEKGELDLDAILNPRRLLYRTNADQIAGYCEGQIRKLFLNLTPEQDELVSYMPKGPLLIRGVAGSGKTTIGIYRAKRIVDYLIEQRGLWDSQHNRYILFATYTETHAAAIREMFIELYGEVPELVHVHTLRDVMLEAIFPKLDTHERRRQLKEEDSYIHRVRFQLKKNDPQAEFFIKYHPNFYVQEITDVIEALGITNEQDYVSVKRVGRGFGLNRSTERPLMWKLYEEYNHTILPEGIVTYSNLPIYAEQSLSVQEVRKYDAIIVDEAQDLTPTSIRFAARLLKDKQGRGFTLLADVAQSIYYRGVPWKEGGINITGQRSKALGKNFRNTRPILEAASQILDPCVQLKAKEEYIKPEVTNKHGPKPLLIRYGNDRQQQKYIIEEILRLSESMKYRLSDIAILGRNQQIVDSMSRPLGKADIPFMHFRRDDFKILGNGVKLITMHSAKGLEFPIVFLMSLEEGIIPYTQDDPEALEQERRLLYVSMTRACDRLYLFYPSRSSSSLLYNLSDDWFNRLILSSN